MPDRPLEGPHQHEAGQRQFAAEEDRQHRDENLARQPLQAGREGKRGQWCGHPIEERQIPIGHEGQPKEGNDREQVGQVETRAKKRAGDSQEPKDPFEMPDQFGRRSLQDEGRNVFRDLAAKDVAAAVGDAAKQAQGKHHRIDTVGSDERSQHAQTKHDRKWPNRGRMLACEGPAANPARPEPGSREVHRHQQGTERGQPLAVAPHDLRERQSDPRPARLPRLRA